jgi:general secretion pathway protein G
LATHCYCPLGLCSRYDLWNRPTFRRSRQPPTFLFAVRVGDSPLPGFVAAQSPAAAAQLSVGGVMSSMHPQSHSDASAERLGLAVVAVIALVVVLVIAIRPRRGDSGAQWVATMSQVAAFKTALEAFRLDTGAYPSGTNGLDALVRPAQGTTNWRGPYMERIPKDPWGCDYNYSCPGSHSASGYPYDLYSPGAAKTEHPVANWMDPSLKPL